jgi:hypothetical protein
VAGAGADLEDGGAGAKPASLGEDPEDLGRVAGPAVVIAIRVAVEAAG